MVLIAKRFKTYVSLKKIHCFLGKVPFSLRNLGPSPRKIHYFMGSFFYSMGNFVGITT
jgi:hypothetical protein